MDPERAPGASEAKSAEEQPLTISRWRPRGLAAWALTVVACPLALIATACFSYTLRPGEYDGLGWLGSTALVFPLQFLAVTVLGAGLAVLAWRLGALLPASAFTLVVAVTAATALWPSIALWQRARHDHISLSLGAALIPRLNSGGPALEGSVVYATARDGTRLKLDVWRAHSAATGALHPAVVRVHGGAWIQGTRSDLSDWDRWLNRLGYDVFDIDYRMPPPVRWRDEVGDVKCALGWVAAHADTYHVDPNRISVMGYSAGGNLALLAAYSMGDPRLPASCSTSTVTVRSAVNLYGPPDLSLIYRSSSSTDYIDNVLERYIGGTPSEYPGRYRSLSPLSHVSARTPPTITVLGERDRLVPTDQAHVLDRALTNAGVAHETLLLPGQDHGFDANWSGLGTQFARAKVRAFLGRYG
jgi:acetyl esterase/lipase